MTKLLIFKVGNKCAGYRDGMLVTVEEDCLLSLHMLKVYAIIKVDSITDDVCKAYGLGEEEGIAYNEEPIDEDEDDFVPYGVNLCELAAALGDPGLEDRWRSTESVDVQTLPEVNMKPMSEVEENEHPDNNVVSQGSYTVGVGGDYTQWLTAAADTTDLTGDLTFTMISDFTSTGRAYFLNMALNGFTLRLTTNNPHNGDPTQGWTWFNHGGTSGSQTEGIKYQTNSGSNGGTFEIDGFRVIRTKFQNDPSRGPFHFSDNEVYTMELHDIIADYVGTTFGRGGRFKSNSTKYKIWNCIFNGFRPNLSNNGGEGVAMFSGGAGSSIENCVFSRCKVGMSLGFETDWTVINCAVFFNDLAGFTDEEASTGLNNASDDGTADTFAVSSNAVTGLIPEDHFVSLDPLSPDYMKLVIPEDNDQFWIGNLGARPLIPENTYGIRRNPRPGTDGCYSIGCDEEDYIGGNFFDSLGQARGKPAQGAMPLRLIERLGAEMVPMLFYEPGVLEFHQEYYYNTRLNVLFKRKILSEFHAVWQPVNIA